MHALALAVALALGGAPAAAPNGKAAFAQLKKLEGNWKTGEKETQTFVEFRVIAGGTAVLETVTGADHTTFTEVTTFYLDGNDLVATSFTADGVVPMKAAGSTARAVRFEATKKGANRSVSLMQKDADDLTREVSHGAKAKSTLELKREYVDTLK